MRKRNVSSEYSYAMPATFNEFPDNRYDVAANIAFFLMENGKSIFDSFRTRMRANDQRRLFGRFLGKGRLLIDGEDERVVNVVKVDFGTDVAWSDWIDCKEARR